MDSSMTLHVSDNDDEDGGGVATSTPPPPNVVPTTVGSSTAGSSPTSFSHPVHPASVYVAYPRPVMPHNGMLAHSTPLMPSTVGRHNGFLRTYKVLVVGEAGVGKSNLMHRYCHNQYDPSLPSTIGAEFCSREVDIPSGPVGQTESVVLQLWDTAGQERNAGVISNAFYRNAVGAIIVYDVTRRETLLNVPRWVARVMELAREECVCVVVGAKVDLLKASQGASAEMAALQTEADRISHALGTRNFLTSALSGEGVLEAFTHLVLAVDAVQASPPLPDSGARARDTLGVGVGTSGGHTRPMFKSGSEMWTAAATVPASPVTLFNSPTSRRWNEAGATGGHHDAPFGVGNNVSSSTSPPSLSPGMTPSASGYMSPGTTGNAAGFRSPSGTPGGRHKKALDLRGFGPGEQGASAPAAANAGVYGDPSWGC